jgi:serine/threonine protein kinase
MADLPVGYSIQTKAFKKVVIANHPTLKEKDGKPKSKLGEGGQGAVYYINYGGQEKVLKWYSGKKFKNAAKFYANLENNIKTGKPTDAFLWPEDITEKDGDAFGYIMNLRPGEYKDFSLFLLGRETFASITAMANASLQITAGFGELHRMGYNYQDLNDGNFFINPKNGDVLICDNDNVSEAGQDSGIMGKARYMAPEVVLGKSKPNKPSDRFSLSVILFFLLTRNHPLEGKNAVPVCMDAKHERQIYGENPVFVMDPTDKSNIPVQGLHKGVINNWPFLPKYAQEQFIKAFSKEVLTTPNRRLLTPEWLKLFIRMRSEIYKCSCGEVYFADPVNLNPCPSCKKTNSFPFIIEINKYALPVHERTKLYACHTEKDSEDFKTLCAEVAKKGSDFELKNVSKKNWMVTDGGATTSVAPGAATPLKKGIKIDFGNVNTAEIN